MSSKAVPQTYRAIIDKVIQSVRPDFEENGVEEAVLQALQESWEAKIALSRVADFSSDPRLGAYQNMLPPDTRTARNGNATASGSGSSKKSQTNGSNAAAGLPDIKPDPSPSKASSSKSKAIDQSTSNSTAQNDSNSLGSDLDESDDDLLSDEDENGGDGDNTAAEGDVIIALYEKVNRTKNKWKIVLKDGVLNADGKDYVFSRCQGDFEW